MTDLHESRVRADRRLQKEARDVAIDIATGKISRRHTFIYGIPGAGKTGAGSTFATELRRPPVAGDGSGHVKSILWVVPRSNLRKQVAKEFKKTTGLELAVVKSAKPPFKDAKNPNCVGYVTTYQALTATAAEGRIPSIDLHRDELMIPGSGPWLLIFDECHHLMDVEESTGRTWSQVIAPLEKVAAHVLLMTGTPERQDGIELPWVRYKSSDGLRVPDSEWYGIPPYTFVDALREKALIPIWFDTHDGWVDFLEANEQIRKRIGEEMSEEDARATIRTFLNYESYWLALLDRAVAHWRAWRTKTGYDSRMLVICDSQERAGRILTTLRDPSGRFKIFNAYSAISDDKTAGRNTLEAFREGVGDVLVTVAMAHEGFDVPDLSHVVYLSHIRSMPWAIQALFRGARTDDVARRHGVPWDEQRCHAFVPDDVLMRKIVDRIERDQMIAGIAPREEDAEGLGVGGGPREPRFTPLAAAIGEQAVRVVHALERIPSHLPPARTEVLTSSSPEADAAILQEIEQFSRRRDRIVGRGRTATDIGITWGRNWTNKLKGQSLVRIRDWVKRSLGDPT